MGNFEQQCRRQAVGRLHHPEHELPRDAAALLVHAKGAEVVLDRGLAVDAHGCQIVEHHGQIVIDQRPDLAGQGGLHGRAMVHERVHRPQQVLVGHALGHRRHRDRVEPA